MLFRQGKLHWSVNWEKRDASWKPLNERKPPRKSKLQRSGSIDRIAVTMTQMITSVVRENPERPQAVVNRVVMATSIPSTLHPNFPARRVLIQGKRWNVSGVIRSIISAIVRMGMPPGTGTLTPEVTPDPEEISIPEEAVGDLCPEAGIPIFKISREAEALTHEITEIFGEGILTEVSHVTRVGH